MTRILFFQHGRFSGCNAGILRGLREQFPGIEFRVVDVYAHLRARPWWMAANALRGLVEYGPDLLRGRRTLDAAFFQNRFLFRYVRRLARSHVARWPCDLTFQTQSLFDYSCPGTPNYVYTDHTFKTGLEYAATGHHSWAIVPKAWQVRQESEIYRHAECTFTMSEHVRRTLVESYGVPPDRAECVGAGVNITGAGSTRGDDHFERKRILFVGVRWERKGGPELVAAFRRVRKRIPDAQLVIAGCSPAIDEPGVRVCGRVPTDELRTLYAGATLFCMPSRYEPFGIVFIEAMASGLPVIALDQAAVRDFVTPGTTGLLTPSDDVEALAAALCELLGDPARSRAMGAAARAAVVPRYTWAETAARIARRIRERATA